MITFKQYVESIGGTAALAKLLVCSRQNAHGWVHGMRAPTPKMAAKIILLSHGMLDFNTIYEPYVNNFFKGKTFKFKSVGGKTAEYRF